MKLLTLLVSFFILIKFDPVERSSVSSIQESVRYKVNVRQT